VTVPVEASESGYSTCHWVEHAFRRAQHDQSLGRALAPEVRYTLYLSG